MIGNRQGIVALLIERLTLRFLDIPCHDCSENIAILILISCFFLPFICRPENDNHGASSIVESYRVLYRTSLFILAKWRTRRHQYLRLDVRAAQELGRNSDCIVNVLIESRCWYFSHYVYRGLSRLLLVLLCRFLLVPFILAELYSHGEVADNRIENLESSLVGSQIS